MHNMSTNIIMHYYHSTSKTVKVFIILLIFNHFLEGEEKEERRGKREV